MELIEKTRDGKILFKKRLLVHVDLVKEFYAKMTVIHLKKKDIVKSEVRGVDLEFDNEKLATILGVHGKNGICEYIEEVWEESKYTKPLEITGRFANDATIMKAGRVRSIEMKPSRKGKKSRVTKHQRAPTSPSFIFDSTERSRTAGVDPSGLTSERCLNLRSSEREFERKRASRFHDELEKAKVENAELLALLHKTQTKPHP
ncbi:hypothetical protein Dimus_032362 [Dionaea muscipula]